MYRNLPCIREKHREILIYPRNVCLNASKNPKIKCFVSSHTDRQTINHIELSKTNQLIDAKNLSNQLVIRSKLAGLVEDTVKFLYL